ncbi:MAG: hypothetical protein K6B70_04645 [Clostridia bacterium]|nr:hypothetical protein [Clostridia bacterium]
MSEKINICKDNGENENFKDILYTVESKEHNMDILMRLIKELKNDYPEVKDEDIQIKRSTCCVPIPRDFYLRFTVPRKNVNLKKLGRNVVSEDYVFYSINSTL